MSRFKKKKHQSIARQIPFIQPPIIELPRNYTKRDGFLFKGDIPVSLVTSGIAEAAAQGFLQVDGSEQYKTE